MKGTLAALCAVLLLPLTLTDVPPLLDYPNHLARATVLAFGADDPVIGKFYAAHWSIIPNLATDLVLPPLLHVLPVHLAGRIIVGIAVVLPVLGTIAYSRAAYATRSPWPFASALLAYNSTLLLGFLNFVASIGIALLLAAGWIAWRDRHPRRVIVLTSLGAILLFFCHLVGLIFLFVLVAGYELEWLWRRRASTTSVAWRAAALIPVAGPVLVLYAVSPLATLSTPNQWSSASDKLWQLAFPFSNYLLPLDVATAVMLFGLPLACLLAGRCRIRPCGGFALLLTAVLYVVLPYGYKDTFFLDTRIAVLLAFLACAAVQPRPLPRVAKVAVVTTFATLFAVRMTVLAAVWHEQQRDLLQLREVIATVEPGARVFVTAVSPDEAPRYWQNEPRSRLLSYGIRLDVHLPALLLIERRAYWPFLFDNPTQQPVRTLPPYRELAEHAAALVDHRALATAGRIDLCGYDYLLLLDAGGESDVAHFAADRLRLIAATDAAALFRVKPTACAS